MVIWIIGLSGSGKTTIGRNLYNRMKTSHPNTVLIDGDEIRNIFAHDNSDDAYTHAGRKKNNERIAQLCAWLDRQGINVICCILNIFPERLAWNRKNYSDYFEVFVTAPLETLKRRDQKDLYNTQGKYAKQNIVGIDIPFTPPVRPDCTIDNSRDGQDMSMVAEKILTAAGIET